MKVCRQTTAGNSALEIFRTLQGEGPSMGCPAVFLRLSLCNLHCSWCDTPYTWRWEGSPWPHEDNVFYKKEEQLRDLSPAEVAGELAQLLQPADRLVITGGEPLLQHDDICELLSALGETGGVEIESNGTQLPSEHLDAFVAQYNISPKLANSGNSESLRLKESTLRFFAASEKAIFKFVVAQESDLPEILELVTRFEIKPSSVYLMPEGRSSAELDKRGPWLAEACLKHNFRLTDRLHVRIWGDERGK